MFYPIITEVTLNASPEKIWQALTNPEQMKEWYFSTQGFQPVVGTVFTFYEPGENRKFLHRCEITEVIPLKRLQHTWTYPERSKGSSIVTWNLDPQGTQTIVVNTHEGIESFADGGTDFLRENFVAGWKEILGSLLKKQVEG